MILLSNISKTKISPLMIEVPSKQEQEQEHEVCSTTTTNSTSKKITTTTATTKKAKKTVRFQLEILVREYPIILGDNPSPMIGPPLSIDWNYVESSKTTPISDSMKGKPRKRCGSERCHILLELGYTKQELKTAVKAIKVDQRRRRHTEQQVIVNALMCHHIDTMRNTIRRNLNLQQPKQQGQGLKGQRQRKKVLQGSSSM